MDRTNHSHINTHYLDLQVEVAKSTGLISGVGSSRLAVIQALKCIRLDVDDRFILYPYVKTSDTKEDACPGLDTLPTSATQLYKFADSFQSRSNGGRLYLRIRVGFDADIQDFLRAERNALKGLNASVYLKVLQEPHTLAIGWLLFSNQAMLPEHWVELFEEKFHELATNATNKNTRKGAAMLCVRIGLQFKFIWDQSIA